MDLFSIIYFLIGSCIMYWLASHIPGSRYYDTSFKGYLILTGVGLLIALVFNQCERMNSSNHFQSKMDRVLLQHQKKRLKELNYLLDDLNQYKGLKNQRERTQKLVREIETITQEIDSLQNK